VDAPWDNAVYRAAVEAMAEAVIVTDLGQVVRVWNPASERLFGFKAAEAVGQPLAFLIPERFRATHDAGFAKAVATSTLRVGGRVITTRANHKDPARKLYVDFSFTLLRDDAGTVFGVMAVGRDATEKFLAARAAQPA
jgi:PAS domain S-box-containing protein